MSFDFPASPAEGQQYVPPGSGQSYVYHAPRWIAEGAALVGIPTTMAGLDAQITDGDVVWQTKPATLGDLTMTGGIIKPDNTGALALNGGPDFNANGASIALRGKTSSYNAWGMELYAGGAERVRLDIAGNVGIGTTAPQQLLDVAGVIKATKSGSTVYLNPAFGGAADPAVQSAQNNLVFCTNNNEHMRLDTYGTLGVGIVPKPTMSCSIVSNSDMTLLGGGDNAATSLHFNGYYDTAAGAWKYWYAGFSAAWRLDYNNGDMVLFGSGVKGAAAGTVASMAPKFTITAAGQAIVYGQACWLNNSLGMWQHDNTNMYFRNRNTSNGPFYLGANDLNLVAINNGTMWSATDGFMNLGYGAGRWAQVSAVNGTIQTSDLREKDWIGEPSAAELQVGAAALEIIGSFQWKRRVKEEGSDARIHMGVTAQQVEQIFKDNGLNPYAYSLFCYDRWEAQPGNSEMGLLPVEAGDRFGIRYDELTTLMLAAQAKQIAALEARLAALEKAA
jgi:hypothetical protein